MSFRVGVHLGVAGVGAAGAVLRRTARCEEVETPLPGVEPYFPASALARNFRRFTALKKKKRFTALFLDAASRSRLAVYIQRIYTRNA